MKAGCSDALFGLRDLAMINPHQYSLSARLNVNKNLIKTSNMSVRFLLKW